MVALKQYRQALQNRQAAIIQVKGSHNSYAESVCGASFINRHKLLALTKNDLCINSEPDQFQRYRCHTRNDRMYRNNFINGKCSLRIKTIRSINKKRWLGEKSRYET